MTADGESPRTSKLTDADLLGVIVSFTISDGAADLQMLREQLQSRGLRVDSLKKRVRKIDAFKKAVKDTETRLPPQRDHQTVVRVNSVGHDAQEAHRQIVLQRTLPQRLGGKRGVEFHAAWRVLYDRGTRLRDGTIVNDTIYVERLLPQDQLRPDEAEWLSKMIGDNGENLEARFKHYCTHLDAAAVRTFVRDYLHLLDGANMKPTTSGGLYFVPQKHASELRRLSPLVRALGSHMHLIPLLDDEEQRAVLREAIAADIAEEARALNAELDKILANSNRTVSQATYDGFVARAEGMTARTQRYEHLLNRTLPVTSSPVGLITSMERLKARVRTPRLLTTGKGEQT